LSGDSGAHESAVDVRGSREGAGRGIEVIGAGPEPGAAVRADGLVRLRGLARGYLVVLLLPLLILIFSLLAPSTFATLGTAQTLLTTNAALLILAIGQTYVLIVGEFDLSFAGLIGMSGCLMVGFHGIPVGVALIISLAAALAVGLVNAFFVVLLGVNSLIATLGMSTVTTGIALAATDSATVPNPYGGLGNLITDRFGGIGLPFYIALAGILILWGILERTKLGRNSYFVGSGRRAAAYAGIKVNRVRTLALVVSAFTSWLAGLVLFGQSGSADATFGTGYLLTVIAAVFLGYTAIRPGRFNALGSLVGMLVLAVGTTGIEVLAAPIWMTDVFSGAILFVAVAIANVLGTARGLRALRSAIDLSAPAYNPSPLAQHSATRASKSIHQRRTGGSHGRNILPRHQTDPYGKAFPRNQAGNGRRAAGGRRARACRLQFGFQRLEHVEQRFQQR
jgi:ribose transport system permease protein